MLLKLGSKPNKTFSKHKKGVFSSGSIRHQKYTFQALTQKQIIDHAIKYNYRAYPVFNSGFREIKWPETCQPSDAMASLKLKCQCTSLGA